MIFPCPFCPYNIDTNTPSALVRIRTDVICERCKQKKSNAYIFLCSHFLCEECLNRYMRLYDQNFTSEEVSDRDDYSVTMIEVIEID